MSSAGTSGNTGSAGTEGGAGGTNGTTGGAAAWYADAGLDAETVGHIQNRGWDKDLKTAAVGAIKAHREAEKHIGVPESRAIKLPADPNDAAGWKAVWSKLGAPADAAGYDLNGLKFKSGEVVGDDFKKFFSEKAAAINLPKSQATEYTKAVVEYLDQAEAQEATERQQTITEERNKLKENWGANEGLFKNQAQLGAKRLGVTPEEVAALEGQVGYARTMEMFRKVGALSGEDSWTESTQGGGNNTTLTREAALARKAELLADKDWTDKWQNGDISKNKEMMNLNAIIVGQAA